MEMTLHRALSELKLADAKIEKKILALGTVVGWKQKDKPVFGYVDEAKFIEDNKSTYQSVVDLLNRKTVIKTALVKKNAETNVTINGNVMTIADAITMKANMALEKKLVLQLKTSYNAAASKINKDNEGVRMKLQEAIVAMLGREAAKTKPDEVEMLTRSFMSLHEYLMVDPLDVTNVVREREEQIENFEAEVDAVLSEINGVEKITIPGGEE